MEKWVYCYEIDSRQIENEINLLASIQKHTPHQNPCGSLSNFIPIPIISFKAIQHHDNAILTRTLKHIKQYVETLILH